MARIRRSSETPSCRSRYIRDRVYSGEPEFQDGPMTIRPTPLRITNHGQVPHDPRRPHWRTDSYGRTYYDNPDFPRSPATRSFHAHLPAEEFLRYSAVLTDPLPVDTTPPPSPLKKRTFGNLPEANDKHVVGRSYERQGVYALDSYHQSNDSAGDELNSRLSNLLIFSPSHHDALLSPIAGSPHERTEHNPHSQRRRSVRFDLSAENRECVSYERPHSGHSTTFPVSSISIERSQTAYNETLTRPVSRSHRSQGGGPGTSSPNSGHRLCDRVEPYIASSSPMQQATRTEPLTRTGTKTNDNRRHQTIIYATPNQPVNVPPRRVSHDDGYYSSHPTPSHDAKQLVSTSNRNVMRQEGIERLLNLIDTALQATQRLDPGFEELKRPLSAAQSCLLRQTSALLGESNILPEDWPHVFQAEVVCLERLIERIHDSLLDIQTHPETLNRRSHVDIRGRFARPAEQLTEIVSRLQESMDIALSLSRQESSESAAWRIRSSIHA